KIKNNKICESNEFSSLAVYCPTLPLNLDVCQVESHLPESILPILKFNELLKNNFDPNEKMKYYYKNIYGFIFFLNQLHHITKCIIFKKKFNLTLLSIEFADCEQFHIQNFKFNYQDDCVIKPESELMYSHGYVITLMKCNTCK
ncbi:hypothetical protein A3Q56_05538, partial [Intoshia linei]